MTKHILYHYSEELFYQVTLGQFHNMGKLVLSTPISIEECVLVAIEIEESKGNLPKDLGDANKVATVSAEKKKYDYINLHFYLHF